MIKLKLKYNYNNFFNIGNVLKVYYVVFFKKKKRVYCFIGFCFFKNKNNFKLINVIKKQKIVMLFQENSPFVLKIFNLKMYNTYIKRVSKLYFKNKSHYKDDYTNLKTRIVSNYNSLKATFFKYSYFARPHVRKRRKKKLKLKFKRASRWFVLRNKISDNLDIFNSDNVLKWFFELDSGLFFHFKKRYFFNLYNYYFYENKFFYKNLSFNVNTEFFFEPKTKKTYNLNFSYENFNYEIFEFFDEFYQSAYEHDSPGYINFSKKLKKNVYYGYKPYVSENLKKFKKIKKNSSNILFK